MSGDRKLETIHFNYESQSSAFTIALGDTALFKKMNILFESIFLILKKNEYFVLMNILDFCKMNDFLNKYLGFSLPASKMVVAKCLKII